MWSPATTTRVGAELPVATEMRPPPSVGPGVDPGPPVGGGVGLVVGGSGVQSGSRTVGVGVGGGVIVGARVGWAVGDGVGSGLAVSVGAGVAVNTKVGSPVGEPTATSMGVGGGVATSACVQPAGKASASASNAAGAWSRAKPECLDISGRDPTTTPTAGRPSKPAYGASSHRRFGLVGLRPRVPPGHLSDDAQRVLDTPRGRLDVVVRPVTAVNEVHIGRPEVVDGQLHRLMIWRQCW